VTFNANLSAPIGIWHAMGWVYASKVVVQAMDSIVAML
jgi:hypothetical protein